MPPRDAPVSKEDLRRYTVRELANTFSEEKRDYLEECSEGSENREIQHNISEQLEEGSEETLRVTTRARLNYELYKYSKNAMLIVTSEYDGVLWTRLVTDLKRTFETFRFEVTVTIVPHPAALYAACDQFFQRDFSDYGAAALTIVTTMAVNISTNPRYDDRFIFFEESRVVENFRLNRNPTLFDKPKIYITEANRRSPSRSYHDLPYLDEATYGDVLGLHVPLALPDEVDGSNLLGTYDENRRPLKLLCDKMAEECDDNNVPRIMEQIIGDSKKSFPLLNAFPIEVVNNLSKELYFARTESQ